LAEKWGIGKWIYDLGGFAGLVPLGALEATGFVTYRAGKPPTR